MATSYETFNGDGSTTDFTFSFPYIDQAHVKGYEDEVEDSGLVYLSATQVRFSSAPAVGVDNVKVGRTTPTSVLTDYVNGSTLDEEDLDRALLQSLYVSEEATDSLGDALSKSGSNWNAAALKIINLASGASGTDAVNYNDVVGILGTNAGIPAPANPADDAKGLIASGGTFSWQPIDVTSITASQISDASANSRSLLQAANYAAMKTLLNLVVGVDVQEYDANTAKTNVTRAWTKQQYFTPITGPATGAAAPDWTNGNVVHSTLTGNLTSIAAPVGVSDGATVVWRIKQDATGGRTAAGWNAAYKFSAGGTAITLSTTANAYDVLILERFGSDYLVSKVQDYR